jgi:putative lipoic acid-binding regulatory protein
VSDGSLLSFPCDLPVKVLGRNVEPFRAAAWRIVRAHYGDVDDENIAEQLSRDGTFLSITFTVHASSRDEVDALYRALTSSEDILMVL